ncbi:MAG TPA: hypothetical protein PLA50_00360 [Bacteroidia bacterium]|nr:hypothetical protein [Bacteroidia bacterium]
MNVILLVTMAAILTGTSVEDDKAIKTRFAPYQVRAIYNEFRKSLCKKAVRIGYTYAKAFKAVRSSLLHPKETLLFTSKDEATAFEFIANCEEHIETFQHRRSVILRETRELEVPRYDEDGEDTGIVDKVTMGRIVFDNRSRILAFSSNPNVLRSYGGNVMWDEAAFHRKGRQMWTTIQGRIRWGYWVDVWSSLAMEDTMFDVLASEAEKADSDWDFSRIDIHDAVADGLVELINEVRGTNLTREEFVAQAKKDAVLPDIYALDYEIRKSNTLSPIVAWEVLKACERPALRIERAHLSHEDIESLFGRAESSPSAMRRRAVERWILATFPRLLSTRGGSSRRFRLGFDVAASRKGHLASVWIEEARGDTFEHRALLTFRTEDWDVMQWCLEILMARMPGEVRGRGDETGLGRAICWKLSKLFHGRFEGVNFTSARRDLGTALMERLAARRLVLSPEHPDIVQDIYCLRKGVKGKEIVWFEVKNDLLPESHADIAWSAALAAWADMDGGSEVWVLDQ